MNPWTSLLPSLFSLMFLLLGAPPELKPTGKLLGTPILYHGDPIVSLSLLDSGQTVLSIGEDPGSRTRSGRIFHLEKGTHRTLDIPGPHRFEAFWLGSSGRTGGTTHLSSLMPETLEERLPGPGDTLGALRKPYLSDLVVLLHDHGVSPIGGIRCPTIRRLKSPDRATLNRQPGLHFEGRGSIFSFPEAKSQGPLPEGPPVLALALSPDARRVVTTHLASSSSPRGMTRGVRVLDGEVLWSREMGPARRIEFSPDGTQVVLTDFSGPGPRRGFVVLDSKNGEIRRREDDAFEIGAARDIRFDPRDTTLYVLGGSPNELPVVRVDLTGRSAPRYMGRKDSGSRTALALSSDSRSLATGGDSGIIEFISLPASPSPSAPRSASALAQAKAQSGSEAIHRSPLVEILILEGERPGELRLLSLDAEGRLSVRDREGNVVTSQDLASLPIPPLLPQTPLHTHPLARMALAAGTHPLKPSKPVLFLAPPRSGSLLGACFENPTGPPKIQLLERRIEPPLETSCLDANQDFIALGQLDGSLRVFRLGAPSSATDQRLPELHPTPPVAVRLFQSPQGPGLVSVTEREFVLFRLEEGPPYAHWFKRRKLPPRASSPLAIPRAGNPLYYSRQISTKKTPWGEPIDEPPRWVLESLDIGRDETLARSAILPSKPLGIAISENGEHVAVAFSEGGIQVLSRDLKLLLSGDGRAHPRCLAFDPAGKILAVGSADSTLTIFEIP